MTGQKYRVAILMDTDRITLTEDPTEYDSEAEAWRAATRESIIAPFLRYTVVRIEPL